MKVALWRRCVTKYVVPHLPGTWVVHGYMVYREPVNWLLCCIGLHNSAWSSDFRVARVVQLLCLPRSGLAGPESWHLGQGTAGTLWTAPTSLADAEPIMRQITKLTIEEALPYFETSGTIAGYSNEAVQRAERSPQNVKIQEEMYYLYLLQGQTAAATEAAEAVRRAGTADGRAWALECVSRVQHINDTAKNDVQEAICIIRQQANQTRTSIGLPTDLG